MKLLLVLIVGVLIGAGAFWFMANRHNDPDMRDMRRDMTEGASRLGDSMKTAVKDIDVDEIKAELERTGRVVRDKARDAGKAAKEVAGNTFISTEVKSKLIAEPNLSAFKINVDTTDGVVTLSGTVANYDQIARAMRVAFEVEGVRQVISTLQIKP